jgi:2-polyprenyl-3-methyl-5-hydroxy-6-metoxy-1,4-benzoquinol methylase
MTNLSEPQRLTQIEDWEDWGTPEVPDIADLDYFPGHQKELWQDLLAKHCPKGKNTKLIEIGSAPGVFVARLAKMLGATPYGIEFTNSGANVNRLFFQKLGYPAENVIHGDFFDDNVLKDHLGKFDVVMSNGFVEHFENPHDVVARHLSLLKPGGILVVAIPNLLGAFKLYGRWAVPGYKRIHNLELMKLDRFKAANTHVDLTTLECKYCGTLHVNVDPMPTRGIGKALFKMWILFEAVIHRLRRMITPNVFFNSAAFSPFIVYIGKKAG